MRAELFFTLLNGCGAMALVAICFGQIERLRLPGIYRSLLQGLLFGSGAAIAIYSGTQVLPGYFVDARSIFIAFSGAFGGPLAAIVAIAMALVARFMKGGDGLYPAMIALPIAAFVGLGWRALLGQRKASLTSLLTLGLGVSSTFAVSPFFLSLAQIAALSDKIVMIAATNLLLAVILGSFVERERRHQQREAELFAESRTDPLTGLLNRRSLESPANQMLADAGADRPVSVLAMDLDHFKDVNDRYGHAFGDEVLRSVAALIRTHLSRHGLVARVGGEEFVAVLQCNENAARSLARAVLLDMDQSSILFGLTPVRITISIGAVTSEESSTFDDAFLQADTALYSAKRLGRNRVECAPIRRARMAA